MDGQDTAHAAAVVVMEHEHGADLAMVETSDKSDVLGHHLSLWLATLVLTIEVLSLTGQCGQPARFHVVVEQDHDQEPTLVMVLSQNNRLAEQEYAVEAWNGPDGTNAAQPVDRELKFEFDQISAQMFQIKAKLKFAI